MTVIIIRIVKAICINYNDLIIVQQLLIKIILLGQTEGLKHLLWMVPLPIQSLALSILKIQSQELTLSISRYGKKSILFAFTNKNDQFPFLQMKK